MGQIKDARDLIARINEFERKHAELDKTGEPQVGIFWVVDGTPIIFGTCWSLAEKTGNIRSSDAGHADFWPRIPFKDQKQKTYPYDYFPRGRTIYDEEKELFYLYADRCILTNEFISRQIMAEMRLPEEKTRLETDFHYQCAGCNPDYLSFAER